VLLLIVIKHSKRAAPQKLQSVKVRGGKELRACLKSFLLTLLRNFLFLEKQQAPPSLVLFCSHRVSFPSFLPSVYFAILDILFVASEGVVL
jgi:hypothetical protein